MNKLADNQKLVFTSHIYDGPIRSISKMLSKSSNKTEAFRFLQITSIDSPANNLEFKMDSQPIVIYTGAANF